MRTLPEGFEETDLQESLRDGWGVQPISWRYLPVGGGSYHWVVDDAGGRHFVTVDDLDQKGYLAATRDSSFQALRSAFDTALALRWQGGLEFVVAPRRARDGESVRRPTDRHAIALFPYVNGPTPGFEGELTAGQRGELIQALVRLHRATPLARPMARTASMQPAGRDVIDSALRELDREWVGGPFSEQARLLIQQHAEPVRRLLERFDHLADNVASDADFVITHGEPHGGNVIDVDGQLVLVDWDTVALAPPERDLWMASAESDQAIYADLSGRRPNAGLIELYRMRWTLEDIAAFVSRFRSAHRRSADDEHVWQSLIRAVSSRG